VAMTLRLTAGEAEDLRARALTEHTSMQDLARRALREYLVAHQRPSPLDLVLDEELVRYGGAVEQLARWRD
jgi:plasmid stability protein